MSREADCFGGAGFLGDQVDIVFLLVDPGDLIVVAEVEQGDELLALVVAPDAQDVVIVGLHDPGVGLVVKDLVLGADGLERAEGLEDPALAGRRVVPLRGLVPVEVAAVQVAAVIPFEPVLMIGIVIFLADLIAAVEDRDAALGEEEGVEHDVQTDGPLQLPVILLVLGGLDAAQRSGRTAQAGVAQAGIVVVELSAGIAVIASAGQVVIEIFLVGDLLHAELFEEIVIEAPADIVVAAQVVEEGVLVGQGEDGLHLVAEQAHVLCRHCVPGAGHGRDVVDHVALGLFQGPEIGDDLGGLHDDLSEQEGAGADDLGRHAHEADQGVDLGQVAAVGAQLLPDIGGRVQADDVDAVVAEVEHVGRHVIENDRIGVIQVPLVGIEGGHDHLAGLLAPGEIAGRGRREDLGNSLFKFIGDGPVVIEEIPVLVLLFAGPGAPGPLVVLAGMVHDEVQADTHAAVVALIAQLRQVLHGAQLGLDLAEVGNRVTPVAAARGALQQGHQVQVIEPALLQVVQVLLHALQRPGKTVGIHEHAQHLISLIPLRHLFPGLVPLLQNRASLRIVLMEHTAEIIKSLLVVVVELGVQPLELIVVTFQSAAKLRLPVFFFKHDTLLLRFLFLCFADPITGWSRLTCPARNPSRGSAHRLHRALCMSSAHRLHRALSMSSAHRLPGSFVKAPGRFSGLLVIDFTLIEYYKKNINLPQSAKL